MRAELPRGEVMRDASLDQIRLADGSYVTIDTKPLHLGRKHVPARFKRYTSREQCVVALIGGKPSLISTGKSRATFVLPPRCTLEDLDKRIMCLENGTPTVLESGTLLAAPPPPLYSREDIVRAWPTQKS